MGFSTDQLHVFDDVQIPRKQEVLVVHEPDEHCTLVEHPLPADFLALQ
jgi:hypothetical protein